MGMVNRGVNGGGKCIAGGHGPGGFEV